MAGGRQLGGKWEFQCLRCLADDGSDGLLSDSDSCFEDVDEKEDEDESEEEDMEGESCEDAEYIDPHTPDTVISQCLRQMSRDGILSDVEDDFDLDEDVEDVEEDEEDEDEGEEEEDEDKEAACRVNKLYCFICETHLCFDDFSAIQRQHEDEEDRYCLRHSSTSAFNQRAVVSVKAKPKYRSGSGSTSSSTS